MEYIKLDSLQNQYPTTENYKSRVKDYITLEGIYPSKNKINFKISPTNEIRLDDITSVDGTNFRFILNIKERPTDIIGKLYTSPQFIKDLQSSVNEPNPYFISNALKKEFIVEYVLENIKKSVIDYRKDEKKNFLVDVNRHFFIKADNSIDYDTLVKYIDFVVSTPALTDGSVRGAIPASQLLSKKDFKIQELKLKDLPKLNLTSGTTSGTTGGTTSGTTGGTGGGDNRRNPSNEDQSQTT